MTRGAGNQGIVIGMGGRCRAPTPARAATGFLARGGFRFFELLGEVLGDIGGELDLGSQGVLEEGLGLLSFLCKEFLRGAGLFCAFFGPVFCALVGDQRLPGDRSFGLLVDLSLRSGIHRLLDGTLGRGVSTLDSGRRG